MSTSFSTAPLPTPAPGWRSLSEAELRHAFEGCVSVETVSDGLRPWRLRYREAAFIPPDLLPRTLCTAGVRLHLRTNATAIRLSVTPKLTTPAFAGDGAKFDLLVDSHYGGTASIPEEGQGTITFELGSSAAKEVEIYFPLHLEVTLHSAEITDGALIGAVPHRPRWITHGSSITHCRAAASPAYTWPAIVAREKGWEHWNMGYGGQCRFEQIVARTIRDMPAERISLCLGINTNTDSYTPRTWAPTVEGFLMTIRDGHPTTPLLIVSPIISPPRETASDRLSTIPLTAMRQELEAIVAKFRAAGDTQITYLDGLQIIGPDDVDTMPDQLHPDANGIKLMAQRFLERTPSEWTTKA